MASISLPTGSYSFPEPRASVRRLVNCFAEVAPNISPDDSKDKQTPVILRRSPGIVPWASDGTSNPVRGLHIMSGILYTVVGGNLYSVDSGGSMLLVGSGITGTGLVKMADNGNCLVIILPNTSIGYVYFPTTTLSITASGNISAGEVGTTLSDAWPYFITQANVTFSDNETRQVTFTQGSTNISWSNGLTSNVNSDLEVTFFSNFLQLTDPTFIQFGALNLGFIDSYIVFLAINGKEFYNCDEATISGTGPITFTQASEFVREFGTDPFVGMVIDHRSIYMLGQLTSEIYIDAGNQEGSPFDSAPNNFIEIGCAVGLTIEKQSQSFYWLANDRTVRSGAQGTRVSNFGIESILEQANITGAYALSYSIAGHDFYVLTLPNEQRTLVLDTGLGEWHELASPGLNYWTPYCAVNAYGRWLVGDSKTGTIGYLDTKVFTEFGVNKEAMWIHQPIYSSHNRLRHIRLELVMGTGRSPLATYQQTQEGQFGPTWTTKQQLGVQAPLGGNTSLGTSTSGSSGSTWVPTPHMGVSFIGDPPPGVPTIVAPKITMEISDNGGLTWRTFPTRDLGQDGEYKTRVQWWRLGMARDRVYRFKLSDPVEMWVTDVQLEASPALH